MSLKILRYMDIQYVKVSVIAFCAKGNCKLIMPRVTINSPAKLNYD